MVTMISDDFGPRVAYTQADFDNNQFKQIAATDGLVMAVVGTVTPTFELAYMGMLTGATTDSSGNVTSSFFATGTTQAITASVGKKGSKTFYLPQTATFTMPVRRGETWHLQLVTEPSIAPAPNVEFYWMPDTEDGLSSSKPYAGCMYQALKKLGEEVRSGRLQATMLASAQRTIDQRVNDLATILGEATSMKKGEAERQRFIQQLQKIVCSAVLPGTTADNRADDKHIQELIATFAEVTDHSFNEEQKKLLDAGIRALVEINDNAANRSNLVLIHANINLFLDNVEQVCAMNLGHSERRLLTRALIRLVGNGQ